MFNQAECCGKPETCERNCAQAEAGRSFLGRASVPVGRAAPRPPEPPLPIVCFDIERRHFYAATAKLLADPDLAKKDVALEIESTISVLRQMGRFEGLTIDA